MHIARILIASVVAGLALPAAAQDMPPGQISTNIRDRATSTIAPQLAFELSRDLLAGSGRSRAGETLPEIAFAPLSITSRGMQRGDDAYARSTQKAEIGASNDGGNATFKFVHTTNELSIAGNDVFTVTGRLKTLSIAISAPFEKGSTESAIITAAGLPSDFNATIGYSVVFWSGEFNFNARVKDRDSLIVVCHEKLGTGPTEDNVPCEQSNEDTLEKIAARDSVRPNYFHTWILGGEASVGYQKFDFFDMATTVKNNTTKTPWSASAYVGWIWGDEAPLLLAKIAYKDSFKAAKDGTLCPVPAPVPTVLTCVTGAIGVPAETQSFVTTLEMRRELKLNGALNDVGIDSLGIDAKFTYDTKSDVYAFDLPLSFAVDDKGNLVGGVDFGWQSDHHEFIAGVFLNSAFSLF
jgi:hypothetical protein